MTLVGALAKLTLHVGTSGKSRRAIAQQFLDANADKPYLETFVTLAMGYAQRCTWSEITDFMGYGQAVLIHSKHGAFWLAPEPETYGPEPTIVASWLFHLGVGFAEALA